MGIEGGSVDYARPEQAARKKRRRMVLAGAVVLGITVLTGFLMLLKPAAPSVDRRSLWIGTVQRGAMDCDVRGPGKLVPQEIRWIPAASTGRVDQILVQPGAAVSATALLLVLSNPDVVQAARSADWNLRTERARLSDLRARLQSDEMSQQSHAASVHADSEEARLNADAEEALSKEGLVADLTLRIAESRSKEAHLCDALEQNRLALFAQSMKAQIAAEEAKVAQAKEVAALRRSQAEALEVRAGIDGVLQELPVEVGQQVQEGTILAKVARPDRLKAEIQVAETQARDIQPGQAATIDTHGATVDGHVVRISPMVREGTVNVEVALDGPPPRGARPDQSIEGTIHLAHLEDVLTVGRPASIGDGSDVSLFKLVDGGKAAVRVPVRLGRVSVSAIQILRGLSVGDQVILSDMSEYDGTNRVRIR